jgi:hypothetical protein
MGESLAQNPNFTNIDGFERNGLLLSTWRRNASRPVRQITEAALFAGIENG